MQLDPTVERHHLVSKGYQRNFAGDEHRVAVLDSRSGQLVNNGRPIKSNFTAPGYNSHVSVDGSSSNELERIWADQERAILDQIRRVALPRATSDQHQAIAALFALHLVRSPPFRDMHERIVADVGATKIPAFATDPELRERYRRQTSREPTTDELLDLVEATFTTLGEGNRHHVDSMVTQYNNISEMLAGYHPQLIEIGPDVDGGFVLADVPIAHTNRRTHQYGFRDDLAVGDATLVTGPLSRRIAVAFSARRESAVTIRTKKMLHSINAVFIRNAMAEIACHPDDARETRRAIEHQQQLSIHRLQQAP